MGQSPRQTYKQKRDDTFIQILCTSRKKINVYTITDGRDLYLSSPLPSSVEIPNFASYTAF